MSYPIYDMYIIYIAIDNFNIINHIMTHDLHIVVLFMLFYVHGIDDPQKSCLQVW